MPNRAKATKSHEFPDFSVAIDGVQHALAHWVQGMFELSQEVARFAQSRMREDIAHWQALVNCRKMDQIRIYQDRFVADALKEYADELATLSHMTVSLVGDGMALAQPRSAQGSNEHEPKM